MAGYITLTLLVGCLGAYLSSWHGGNAPPKVKTKFIKNLTWAFPAALLNGAILGLPGYVLGLLNMLKATGHGAFMDMGSNAKEPGKGRLIEKVEYLIYPWLFTRVDRYLYDAVGLALTGLLSVCGSIVVYASVCWPAAIVAAFGGIMKAPSYAIGWMIFPMPSDDRNTRTGEILSGFFAYAGIMAGFLMVLHAR